MKLQDFWFLVGCVFFSRFAPEWAAALAGCLAFLLSLFISGSRSYLKRVHGVSGKEFDAEMQKHLDR